jgi:hypothetical protein
MQWKQRFTKSKITRQKEMESILRKENPTEEERKAVLEFVKKANPKGFEEAVKRH